jgi:hypothetical protein
MFAFRHPYPRPKPGFSRHIRVDSFTSVLLLWYLWFLLGTSWYRTHQLCCGARMHPLRAKYLASETALSMAINAAISVAFAWLVFHGHDQVPSSGPGGLVRDAAPQTFMVALMSTLVPSLVTRKRMHSGHLDAWLSGKPGGSPAPTGKIFLRALMLAIVAMALGLSLNAAVLPLLFPGGLGYGRVLVLKAGYGALVALVITPLAISWVLKEYLPQILPRGEI